VHQGNNYETLPFHVMRRRVDLSFKDKFFWESKVVYVELSNISIADLSKDTTNVDFQSWREFGEQHESFYQTRAFHLTNIYQESYYNNTGFPLTLPHYFKNIYRYDIETDPSDLMPSLPSLCAKDACSNSFELTPDFFIKNWTNVNLRFLLNKRSYKRRVRRLLKKRKYKTTWPKFRNWWFTRQDHIRTFTKRSMSLKLLKIKRFRRRVRNRLYLLSILVYDRPRRTFKLNRIRFSASRHLNKLYTKRYFKYDRNFQNQLKATSTRSTILNSTYNKLNKLL